jgi:hypothetical protein
MFYNRKMKSMDKKTPTSLVEKNEKCRLWCCSDVGLILILINDQLCNPGQVVASRLWASVFPSVKWGSPKPHPWMLGLWQGLIEGLA